MRAKSLQLNRAIVGLLLSLLLGVALSGLACSTDSSVLQGPASPDGDLETTEFEDFHSTPQDFPASAGRFLLPPGFEARWPLEQYPRDISSSFGPRLKASEASRPDFHRGIDIPGDLGQSIFPILPGTLYKVVAGGESSEGGNVVTVEHELDAPVTFHGKSITRFYSQYAHLDEFGPKALEWLEDPEAEIEIGPEEILGTVGQSGTTTFNHLHFEIRLETTCSLEFQVENPQTLCAANGFDPHVNPLQFLLGDDGKAPSLVSVSLEDGFFKVRVASDGLYADLDYVVLQSFDGSGHLLREFRIGFNAREGFDATSTESLDDPQLDGVLLIPEPFLSNSPIHEMNYSFDMKGLSSAPARVRLLAEDVSGNGFIANFNLE